MKNRIRFVIIGKLVKSHLKNCRIQTSNRFEIGPTSSQNSKKEILPKLWGSSITFFHDDRKATRVWCISLKFKRSNVFDIFTERINFDTLFSRAARHTTVYFVGNPSLTKYIETSCNKYKLPFIRDYTNGTFPKNDKTTMMRYFNGLVKSIIAAVLFLFILSIYVKSD